MNWRIEVKPATEKQYLKLDRTMRSRIKKGMQELEKADDPIFCKNVRPLTGQLKGDFRLRVGAWRILFAVGREEMLIYVYAILPRGSTYKD